MTRDACTSSQFTQKQRHDSNHSIFLERRKEHMIRIVISVLPCSEFDLPTSRSQWARRVAEYENNRKIKSMLFSGFFLYFFRYIKFYAYACASYAKKNKASAVELLLCHSTCVGPSPYSLYNFGVRRKFQNDMSMD